MDILEIMNIPYYKEGNTIHIKKENRGKFTRSAKEHNMGVQEFATHVLNNKDEYSSTLVKRANFAKNTKKFKHAKGGLIKKCQEGEILDNQQIYTAGYTDPVTVAASRKLTRKQQMQADEEWREYLKHHPIQIGSEEYNRLPEKAKAQVYKNKVTDTIDKAALPTAAAIVAPTLLTSVGASVLPAAGKAVGTVLADPFVDAALTVHGAVTAPENVKQGIQQIKDGETLKGVGNLALVGLDVTGASNLMKTYSRVKKLLKPVNLNINNFDDSVNDALRFYKTHINPNASLSDYRIYQANNLPFQHTGEYIPSTKTIRISKKENPIITRDTIVHEMRHQDDPLIHDQSDFSVFTLDDNRVNHYGRLNLTNEQSKMLDNVYSDIKLESERIAVNAGYKASLEKMYIKEYGKIPTVKELNDYIQTLSRGMLTLGRYISGYPSITSWISPVLKTKQLKNSLINIK